MMQDNTPERWLCVCCEDWSTEIDDDDLCPACARDKRQAEIDDLHGQEVDA